ncbi:MAG: FliH/SctL family protein [Acidimicrobiales bacterium]
MTTNRPRVLKAADVASVADLTVDLRPFAAYANGDATGEPATLAHGNGDHGRTIDLAEVEQRCADAHARGLAEGSDQLRDALETTRGSLDQLLEARPDALVAAMRADTRDVVDAAIALARWVLAKELADPDTLWEMVQRALLHAESPTPLRIQVQPDVASVLRDLVGPDITVVADGNLTSGEFVCRTDGPTISFRVEEALALASTALEGDDDGTR